MTDDTTDTTGTQPSDHQLQPRPYGTAALFFIGAVVALNAGYPGIAAVAGVTSAVAAIFAVAVRRGGV